MSAWLGGRYAISNNFEVTATGFVEPPATVFQNDVNLVTESGRYPGTTRHQFMRFGAQGGVRLVFGMIVRFHLGLELGWSQAMYSGQQHFDVTNAESATNYGLTIPDASIPSAVLSPNLGIEWCFRDNWSLSLLPRAQLQLASTVSWAVIVPIQLSWSLYL
ncbi:MAG: hypothetical protein QM817_40685 [Archangium sp.]